MEQAAKILENSEVNHARIRKKLMPANCILVRDGGIAVKVMPAFFELYKWSIIMYGQLPSEKAIANLIGTEFQYTKALELQLDEQYLRQMAKILIEGCYDVKYIHLKGPDEPGHDHEPWRKVEAIESIDRFFMQ